MTQGERGFNTSHVKVNHSPLYARASSELVSIHPMLKLIHGHVVWQSQSVLFQYIPC